MFEKIAEFERALAAYTGAPYAIMTDCCTHALELCFIYDQVRRTRFTAFTYLSVPMTMHKLKISYGLTGEQWTGEYQFSNTRIWDSARCLEPLMYRTGQLQCLSFGHTKPMQIGRAGAILLDDEPAYRRLLRMRSDGRDLSISPWQSQQEFELGYHYNGRPEEAIRGLELLQSVIPQRQKGNYPDCRQIIIKS